MMSGDRRLTPEDLDHIEEAPPRTRRRPQVRPGTTTPW
jgi:hypothetical protein